MRLSNQFAVFLFSFLAFITLSNTVTQAQVTCPGLPANFGFSYSAWVFDIDARTCTRNATNPANGFRLFTNRGQISILEYIHMGVPRHLHYAGSAAASGVTFADITPTTAAAGVSSTLVVDGFVVRLIFQTPTSAGQQTYTATIVRGGITYTIEIFGEIHSNTNTHNITSITVTGGAFGGDTNASDHLASQQSFFTQLIMNHQSYNMVSGVGSNLDSLFNGNGLSPFVSMNGFSYQSTGAEKWRRKKQREADAKQPKAALNILADHSKAAQRKNSVNTNTDLMSYNSRERTSSDAVTKLDQVANKDVYAADVTPIDEIAVTSPWNFWVKGSWAFYDGHESSFFEGHMVDVVGGVDYRLSDDLIVGALVGYGVADFDTLNSGVAGSFKADGVHVGAYMGKRLAPNLMLDALVAYTASDYDNSAGTTTGSFDGHRVTVVAHLKGNIDWGMVTVQPTIGFMVASERQDAYTDSASVAHSAKTITAGRLSIGPKFMFQAVENDHGSTQFWFAAKGEYDFSNQNNNANSSLPDISDIASARLQAGIIAASHNDAISGR